jgi:hypothetical protein
VRAARSATGKNRTNASVSWARNPKTSTADHAAHSDTAHPQNVADTSATRAMSTTLHHDKIVATKTLTIAHNAHTHTHMHMHMQGTHVHDAHSHIHMVRTHTCMHAHTCAYTRAHSRPCASVFMRYAAESR